MLYTFKKMSLSKYEFDEISCEQSKVWSFALSHFLFSKSFKVSAKKYKRVKELNTDLWFQIWYDKFAKFLTNQSKVWNMFFDGLFLSKVHKVWATIIQRSYLSWHWTVMENLNKPWPLCFKNGLRNWVNFH